jgi:hypothetical protein
LELTLPKKIKMFDKDNFIKYVSGVTAGRISKGNEDFEYLWDEHNK